MKLKKLNSKKSKAQAMVEFAIALPVLLVLLYGIMEAGRLLFLYSTVVTASRQAVRYGSATGIGNGTGNVNEHRYEDCDGIRASAQAAGFLGTFDTVTITWDDGPQDVTPTTYCTGAADPTDNSFKPKADNSSRVSVTVVDEFIPILPKLLPFIKRNISATSSRTVIVGVSIQVTSPPVTFIASTPTNTPTNTPSPTNTPTATRTPTKTLTPALSFTPSQTPPATFTPTITFTPTTTSTPVASCSAITRGPITKSGNTMTQTITNPYSYPLTIGDGIVTWNDDKGHQTGSDKTLRLQTITIDSTIVWTGNSSNESSKVWNTPGAIPPNATVTITFTFHQSYDNFDGTEKIFINLSTNGCVGTPIP
jgi:Flp pilus assembly protein TadG